MASIPFATPEQLEERWRALTDEEQPRAAALLKDASVLMASAMAIHGVDYANAESPLAEALVVVCCNMVRRVMAVDVNMPYANQHTQSAVGYSESFTYANPSGDMYMTKAEKQMLGCTGGKVYAIRPAINDGAGEGIANW